MPKSVNFELLERAILHGLYLQGYDVYLIKDITKYLNEEFWPEVMEKIERDIRDMGISNVGRLEVFNRMLQSQLEVGMAGLASRISSHLSDFSEMEADWQLSVLKKSVKVVVNLGSPSPMVLRALVEERAFEGDIMANWFMSLASDTRRRVSKEVGLGLVNGSTVSAISRKIRGTKALGYKDGVLDITRRNAEAIVRTATSNLSAVVREETFKANERVIKGVKWVSVLDSRTSLICQSRDGNIYPVGEGPRPPAHWACRSTVIPIVRSWKELGIPLNEMSEGTRASLNGQVPENITYPEWLKSQPAEIQDIALGPSRAKLFRSGKVKISGFVSGEGRTLTLKQIRKLEGIDR